MKSEIKLNAFYTDIILMMARPLRIKYPGAWYHLMNMGRRDEKILPPTKIKEELS